MITEQGQQEAVSEEGAPESVREAVEQAWQSVEEPAEAAPAEPVKTAEPVAVAPEAGTPKPTPPAEAAQPVTPAADAKPPEGEAEKPASIKTEKAPQSWTPAAREKWATLPGEVRAEVQRREREIQKALQESAPDRQVAAAYRQKVGPYEAMIRSEGVEPLAAVESLLQTAQALRTAPPPHKEAIVAQIIKNHGIDPAGVARVLQGQQPDPGRPQQVDPNTIAAQVRQQVMREMEQRQQSQQTSAMEAQIQEFAQGHEFFEDVAQMLPGIIQGRKAAGLPVTLEQAYSLACQLHPEVSAVVKQREAATQANATTASTQRARAAAASVKGGPAGVRTPAQPQPATVREALEMAWPD